MDLTDIRTERDTPYLDQAAREHFVHCVVYIHYLAWSISVAKLYDMWKEGYSDGIICATFRILECIDIMCVSRLSTGVFII